MQQRYGNKKQAQHRQAIDGIDHGGRQGNGVSNNQHTTEQGAEHNHPAGFHQQHRCFVAAKFGCVVVE